MKTTLWFLLLMIFSPVLLAANIDTGEVLAPTQIVENPRVEDYVTRSLGTEAVDGHLSLVLEAVAKGDPASRKLRYGRIKVWVDVKFGTIRKATLWDNNNRPLLTMHVHEFKYLGDKVVAFHVEIINHTSGEKVMISQKDAGSGPDLILKKFLALNSQVLEEITP